MAVDGLKSGENLLPLNVSTNLLRSDKTGALVATQGHGLYKEAAVAGRLYSLDSDAVTVVVTVGTTKAALGTVKLLNGFANPLASTVNANITKVHVTTVSGTPGGPLYLNYLCGISVNSAATGTIRNRFLSANPAASAMLPQVNVVVTTVGALTTALIQLCTIGGPAAAAAGAGLADAYEEFAGDLIVPPGTIFGILATAVGSSHVVQSTIEWEELPITNT